MMTLHYSKKINAPKEKVWHVMLEDKTYRQWTSSFYPGSYYVGNWEKGSKITFLGPDIEGKTSGMVSKIAENKLYEFISIEHLGNVIDGVEDTTSESAKKWAGAHENYTFEEINGSTLLSVDIDITEEFEEMFKEIWPKALENLKKISENL